MVEHDLAKVGVASSNLVSRSIFLLLFFLLPSSFVYATQTITLNKEYCIEDTDIKASLFGYKEDAIILKVPKERIQFSLSTQQLLDFFHDKNITLIDHSGGVVIFKRQCDLMGKKEILEKAFVAKIHELSPFIVLEDSPTIFTKSLLPQDFKHYVLESISLNETALKKQSGSFMATFMTQKKRKKITFYYEMLAKLPAFKAKRNLQIGKIISNDDFEQVLVSIDALPAKAIIGVLPEHLIVKNHIKEGQIASEYFVDTKKDVMKKETIKAFLTQDNLAIEIEVIVQEDASIGDIVKVKTQNGKVLSAKILSQKEAMILE